MNTPNPLRWTDVTAALMQAGYSGITQLDRRVIVYVKAGRPPIVIPCDLARDSCVTCNNPARD